MYFLFFSKTFWPIDELIKAISSVLYSPDRYSLKTWVLKALCYIFPFILLDIQNKSNLILGDSLLLLVESKVDKLDEILTYQMDQLRWIMSRGEFILKEKVVKIWLLKGDLDILVKVMTTCNYSSILYYFIMDEELDDTTSQK